MKSLNLALAAAMALGSVALTQAPAVAQSLQVGPGGVGVDLRPPGERRLDRERERAMREREMDRRDDRSMRRARRDDDRGCREVTVRERGPRGEMVTRRTRDCR
ncbi:MAG: hypothetical protein JWR08_687 [Enterovirga sp.]|nr:hypothetical protein [Enterovirga sp.]